MSNNSTLDAVLAKIDTNLNASLNRLIGPIPLIKNILIKLPIGWSKILNR
jgi:hypothetical protein